MVIIGFLWFSNRLRALKCSNGRGTESRNCGDGPVNTQDYQVMQLLFETSKGVPAEKHLHQQEKMSHRLSDKL